MRRLLPILALVAVLAGLGYALMRAMSGSEAPRVVEELPPPPWGTGQSRGEDLRILFAVFAPGPADDVASWWGHAALIVEDAQARQGRMYNYGMFDFDKFGQFALGRLEFWVDDDPRVSGILNYYKRQDRDVKLLELDLTPEAKVQMARALADNVLPQNRDYLYAHYDDNCATRLRDMIDVGTGGQYRAAMQAPGRMTLREHTRRYTDVVPWMSVLLDFMMNSSIDQPITRWQEAFLPDEMDLQLAGFRVKRPDGTEVPIVKRVVTLHRSATIAPARAEPPDYTAGLLAVGGGLGALALALAAWLRRTGSRAARILLGLEHALVGLVFGIPGLALVLMWAFTDHTVTFHNENLSLANPLTLLALPLGVSLARGRKAATPRRLALLWAVLAGLALLGVLLKPLPGFTQDNGRLLALMLPAVLGLAAAARLALRPARAAAPQTLDTQSAARAG